MRRGGRHDEARALLAPVTAGMTVGENEAYYTALRFYKGDVTEVQAMTPVTKNDNRLVTVGYGIATAYLANGDSERACGLLQRIAAEPNWNAFGVIAARSRSVAIPGDLPLSPPRPRRTRTRPDRPVGRARPRWPSLVAAEAQNMKRTPN